MGILINETKTRQIDAKKESFNFLGFTMRYDLSIHGGSIRYWNIFQGKKSEQKIRDHIKEYLETHGHCKAQDVARGLNPIMRGWLNYFDIKGVSYPIISKRRCRLYRHNALEVLTTRFGLIDPTKYAYQPTRL